MKRSASDRTGPRADGGFLDHLEVLRRRLLVVLAWFVLASLAAFLLGDRIIELLFLPVGDTRPDLIAISPQEKFVTYLQLAAFVGAITTVPVFLIQVALFVAPALEGREPRSFGVVLAAAHLFFFGGVAFALMIVAPFALSFFMAFGGDDAIVAMWSVAEYVKLLRGIVIGITIVFQTPIVMILLTSAGFVSARTLRGLRRHAIVVSALAGGFLTPPDLFTQVLVGGTLYVLFELSLLIAGLFGKHANGDENV